MVSLHTSSRLILGVVLLQVLFYISLLVLMLFILTPNDVLFRIWRYSWPDPVFLPFLLDCLSDLA